VQREIDHDIAQITRRQVGRPKCNCKQGLTQTIDTAVVHASLASSSRPLAREASTTCGNPWMISRAHASPSPGIRSRFGIMSLMFSMVSSRSIASLRLVCPRESEVAYEGSESQAGPERSSSTPAVLDPLTQRIRNMRPRALR
jgi:hypothetical protein